jgi:hypothetical protein
MVVTIQFRVNVSGTVGAAVVGGAVITGVVGVGVTGDTGCWVVHPATITVPITTIRSRKESVFIIVSLSCSYL